MSTHEKNAGRPLQSSVQDIQDVPGNKIFILNLDWLFAGIVTLLIMWFSQGSILSHGFILQTPLALALAFLIPLLAWLFGLYAGSIFYRVGTRYGIDESSLVYKAGSFAIPLIVQIVVAASGFSFVYGAGLPLLVSTLTFILSLMLYDQIVSSVLHVD
ncbi:MAG: hypothetical protein Q4E22_02440 [Coriobacteriia bacterium]|nr:hypothetical protein [Coriobacteriia bacterium]